MIIIVQSALSPTQKTQLAIDTQRENLHTIADKIETAIIEVVAQNKEMATRKISTIKASDK